MPESPGPGTRRRSWGRGTRYGCVQHAAARSADNGVIIRARVKHAWGTCLVNVHGGAGLAGDGGRGEGDGASRGEHNLLLAGAGACLGHTGGLLVEAASAHTVGAVAGNGVEGLDEAAV